MGFDPHGPIWPTHKRKRAAKRFKRDVALREVAQSGQTREELPISQVCQ